MGRSTNIDHPRRPVPPAILDLLARIDDARREICDDLGRPRAAFSPSHNRARKVAAILDYYELGEFPRHLWAAEDRLTNSSG
jgi:hypothetical protein